ncbi:Ig-like domain-containing protein [Hyalangium rubrum]|uniref:Ig-like domain-containing protein n=1 Tax=Hyalangium rubrum TaxID=3103134 RepID=A0ABU5H4F6_9BACT|nr:Ig-like domain-containing protein [Hyalangium sp. s54d21]MDY7228362.1 Ig-like domain-containing protein [Hyalangium sp. s54d21]
MPASLPWRVAKHVTLAALVLSAAVAAAQSPAVVNNSFEAPRLNPGQYAEPSPEGYGWKTVGPVALVRNGVLAETAPMGHQWLRIRPKGAITQEVQLQPGTYTLSLLAMQGPGNNPALSLQARIGAFNAGVRTPEASLGKVTFSPVTITTAGTYSVRIENTEASNMQQALLVDHVQLNRQGTNTLPVVELTYPAHGQSIVSAFTYLRATPNDGDGTITKVDFYNGATRIGTATSWPWVHANLYVAPGTYSITAVAFDSSGASTTSSPVIFTVGAGGTAPFVRNNNFESIWVGEGNTRSYAPYEWTLSASEAGTTTNQHSSSAGVPTGEGNHAAYLQSMSYNYGGPASISQYVQLPPGTYGVSFRAAQNSSVMTLRVLFNNTQLASIAPGTAFRPFGTSAFTVPSTGNYSLQFSATSSLPQYDGFRAYVDDVRIGPAGPPTIQLTAPASGQSFQAPLALTLVADANDYDGTLSQVEFFHGATSLGVAPYPYSLDWLNVPPGTYSITSRVTDASGLSTVSAPVVVTVQAPAVPAFFNAGFERVHQFGGYSRVMEANGWQSSAQPSAMIVGNTNVYTGSGPVAPEGMQTLLLNGSGWASQGVYFPAGSYTLSLKAAQKQYGFTSNLTFRVLVDGVEAGRFTPPNFAYTGFTTYAFSVATAGVHTIRIEGTNPAASGFSYLSIDDLLINALPANEPPVVSWVSPPDGSSFPHPGSVLLEASASDSDGTIQSVEFLDGSTSLGPATFHPATGTYRLTWAPPQAGSYTLHARAVDNGMASTRTATARTVTFTPTNTAPSVVLTFPLNNALLPFGPVTLTATASDPDGTITGVSFWSNGTLLGAGRLQAGTYRFPFFFSEGGTYSLQAKATDNAGATTASAPVTVTAASGPAPTYTNTRWPTDVEGAGDLIPWGVQAVGGPVTSTQQVTTYVVDSGVQDMPGRLNLIGKTGVTGWMDPPCYVHGTHVAGTIGAMESPSGSPGQRVVGVLSGAKLRSVTRVKYQDYTRCLGANGSLVEALDLVKADILAQPEPRRVAVVNLSLDFEGSSASELIALRAKILELATPAGAYPGAFIAEAAGNQNSNSCEYSYGSLDPLDGIMLVGAVDENGQRVVPLNGTGGFHGIFQGTQPGSNTCADVWAPGKYVKSLGLDGNVAMMSGTSMAAPHVAAVAVHLAEAYGLETPQQIEQAVRAFSFPMPGTGLPVPNTRRRVATAAPSVEFSVNGRAVRADTLKSKDDPTPLFPLVLGVPSFSRYTDDPAFAFRYQSLGASSCLLKGFVNDAFWYEYSDLEHDWGPVNTLGPSTYRWELRCVSANGTATETRAGATVYPVPQVRWFVNDTEIPNGQWFTPPTITTGERFHLRYDGEHVSSCKVQTSQNGLVYPPQAFIPIWESDGNTADAWSYSPSWPHTSYDFYEATVAIPPGTYRWAVECLGMDGARQVSSTIHATITAQ